MHFITTVLLALAPLLALAASSTSTSTTTTSVNTEPLAGPTPAASGAVPGQGAYGYTYAGCYNETTGLSNTGGARAISAGSMDTNNTQTTLSCLTYCHSMSYQYCGLEYGRECWGGKYLSSVSAKLPESNCSVGCAGNNSQVCGGFLALTLFNSTGSGSTSGAGPGIKEAAGAAGAVVLACALGALFSAF